MQRKNKNSAIETILMVVVATFMAVIGYVVWKNTYIVALILSGCFAVRGVLTVVFFQKRNHTVFNAVVEGIMTFVFIRLASLLLFFK